MSDAMSSMDTKCFGCVNWKGSYGNHLCRSCGNVFSGQLKNWYQTQEAIDEMEEDLNSPTKSTLDWYNEMNSISERDAYMNQAKSLAEEHWAYVAGLLAAHRVGSDIIDTVGFHYKSAFVHGFKHAYEELSDGRT